MTLNSIHSVARLFFGTFSDKAQQVEFLIVAYISSVRLYDYATIRPFDHSINHLPNRPIIRTLWKKTIAGGKFLCELKYCVENGFILQLTFYFTAKLN